jgi:transposase-like protein
LTDDGEIEIEVPRDRAGTFEPVIVAKGQTRFDGTARWPWISRTVRPRP